MHWTLLTSNSVGVQEAWKVAATVGRLVVWAAYVVAKTPLAGRAAASGDEVAWAADNMGHEAHGRVGGIAAGMEEDTTDADNAGTEPS